MARIDKSLIANLSVLKSKPLDSAGQSEKKGYSEDVSRVLALTLADELRARGLKETRPAGEGEVGGSGAERRLAGGLGAKKVDVTWATDQAGLIFAISIKTINFRDGKSKTFQKNLTNRRGDMLMEAVTLHRRFPYAVLAAFFFFDQEAEHDDTGKRRSTFLNAHNRLQLFTGRNDPAGREEQFEHFYLFLMDASSTTAPLRAYRVGEPEHEVSISEILDELLRLVAKRNPDFYEFQDGKLRKATGK